MNMRQKLRDFTTERPVAVLMVFLAAMVFGFFSLGRLPITLMPELTYPTITVRTEYPGAAPEEVENDVSRPIEESLGVIGGLKKTSSISRSGVSDVVLEFTWGTDMSEASQATLEKLDLVVLPQEAKRPLILQFDPSLDPIMELSFSGEGSRFEGEQGLRRLRRIAELQVKRALEPVKGVAAIRVRGGLEEEIHVLLDEGKLKRANLSINSVIQRLAEENINVAGGTVKEGRSEYMVRTLNEYENLEQIEETVIVREAGRNLRVKDLGRVELAHKELEITTKNAGRESVQIDIYKEADANMVNLAKAIKEMVGSYKDEEPAKAEAALAKGGNKDDAPMEPELTLAKRIYQDEGAILEVVADRSTFIKSSIDEVKNTAVMGGFLAVFVIFLFLRNVRTTLIIAVSIPMSLLITFAPLNLLGMSLNIMSLGGLALGVGMLVDNSIVVLESIFRCFEEGDDLKTAAVRGTTEVRGAVISSTLTSIAVFFPMVFVEGIAGQAFGDLGLAVVVSLIASLLVAIFFIPMLASRPKVAYNDNEGQSTWLKFTALENFKAGFKACPTWARMLIVPLVYLLLRFVLEFFFELNGKLILAVIGLITLLFGRVLLPVFGGAFVAISYLPAKLTGKIMALLESSYPKMIRWTLANPILIIVIMVGLIWSTAEMGSSLENELLPEIHQGEFTFEVKLPVGTPLERTRNVLEEVEKSILANKEDIQSLLVTFGYDVTNTKRSDEGEHSARFKVLLEPNKDQEKTERRVVDRLRKYFDKIPDIDVQVSRPVLFSEKTPIEVEIQGDDLVVLKKLSAQIRDTLSALPELADVETTLKAGAPEIQVVYDRNQMMNFGLNIGEVARAVRDKVKGNKATSFNMKDRRVPILVRLDQGDRDRLEDISQITTNPGGEHPITLDSIADLMIAEGPSEVRRVDGQRVALINANIAEGSLGTAVTAIQQVLSKKVDWPEGTSYSIAGQSKEWDQSKRSLFLALALSLFLVYVIMAAQFESLVHPLVIMFTIPLAGFGAVLGLKILAIPVSIVVFLGMILLAGIVVNNAIVLIDYINTLRRRGVELKEAIIESGLVRLRPILMTTSTTILGLLPMALGLGDGAEIRTPMAITVIFGLTTSTFLTLLLIPTMYSIVEHWRIRLFGQEPIEAPANSPLEEATV